jgi:hypothetical protein
MTQSTQAAAANAPAFLPLFYKAPVLLSFQEHGKSGLAQPAGFGFAREAAAVPLGTGEFMPAIRHYPIVFSDAGPATPLAVMGLKQGSNLFVEDDGAWRAGHYQPGYVRRYPFIVTEAPDQGATLLAIDAASERFVAQADSDAGASRLFDDTGAATPAARSAMDLCLAFHQDHLRTAAFAAALDEAKLLVPNRAVMQLAGGQNYTLDGFRIVDEKALRALPAETIADWHAKGWLDLITLHLASQRNWQLLLDIHAARNTAQAGAPRH